ncbi:MAG: CPBP family intramembrane metalloprotease [Rubrobacter sp.]|nr:CPBP family intramembrane metalloprotease [Rubrobacter sp.]
MRSLDRKRVVVFLAFAFGVSWATAAVIFFTGGFAESPSLVPGTPITLAFVLLPTAYMFSPALAHVLTRHLTREGWSGLRLAPRFREGWRLWVAAWLGTAFLVLVGAAVFFVVFPGVFDPSLGTIREQISAAEADMGGSVSLPVEALFAIQVASAILVAPLVNSLLAFGEEFGWRAYLQPKLLPLGFRRAMVSIGVIWGVWHWPIIAMGHNYGTDYPGSPWLGFAATLWFTFVVGTFLGYLTLCAGSVWPAVIGHGTLNATAGLPILLSTGEANPLLGPASVGVIGSVGFAVVALFILLRPPQK